MFAGRGQALFVLCPSLAAGKHQRRDVLKLLGPWTFRAKDVLDRQFHHFALLKELEPQEYGSLCKHKESPKPPKSTTLPIYTRSTLPSLNTLPGL